MKNPKPQARKLKREYESKKEKKKVTLCCRDGELRSAGSLSRDKSGSYPVSWFCLPEGFKKPYSNLDSKISILLLCVLDKSGCSSLHLFCQTLNYKEDLSPTPTEKNNYQEQPLPSPSTKSFPHNKGSYGHRTRDTNVQIFKKDNKGIKH